VPTPNNGKCGFANLLTSVLSTAPADQNMAYPPFVFEAHVNFVTGLILTALTKIYPSNQSVIDILDPFVKIELIPVTNGYVQLPLDYRGLLGSPMMFTNPRSTGECGQENILPLTAQTFKAGQLKSGCSLTPIIIKDQAEFSELTRSTYKQPDYESPIAFFSGKKQLKICPYDCTKVAVMYVINEPSYRFAYITQPDDTYVYDAVNSVDTDWGNNAFNLMINGLVSLYAAYTNNKELSDWSKILNEQNII
jgi:hypothetical protein